MNAALLMSLLNPSLWAQLIKVAEEISTLVNHPTVVGVAQAVSDAASAASTVVPAGAGTEITAAVQAAGQAVANAYTTGQPQNVISTVANAGVSAASVELSFPTSSPS